jgi:hypothetical protein
MLWARVCSGIPHFMTQAKLVLRNAPYEDMVGKNL